MAKKKGKKGLLPRKIAGVKIPKSVRKGALGSFIASPVGQKIIAETLLVAGAAIVGRETHPESAVRQALEDPADKLKDASDKAAGALADVSTDSASRVGRAFLAASRAFKEALGSPEPDAADADYDERLGGKKKDFRPAGVVPH